jgi:hypothetical protein
MNRLNQRTARRTASKKVRPHRSHTWLDIPPPLPPAGSTDDNFVWRPENEEVVTNGSKPLAIYVNPWGEIVLRGMSEAAPYSGDPIILISPGEVRPRHRAAAGGCR